MANRSDRRLANLSNPLVLEAVEPIRTRRADFHQGPERRTKLLAEAGYTIATGSVLTPANNFTRGAGSIYVGSNPVRSARQSRLFSDAKKGDWRVLKRIGFRGQPERQYSFRIVTFDRPFSRIRPHVSIDLATVAQSRSG